MEKIVVEKSPALKGRVRISGAKNAALPILAACLLGTEDIYLEEVPDLQDVNIMCKVLESLGSTVEVTGKGKLKINSANLREYKTPFELMNKMRASFLVMGPLLGRLGKTENSLPGGCTIGARPIDYHLKGFRALGADIVEDIGNITASCEKLVGDKIYLDFPSVGATENIMMAAVLAQGETVIENAAKEPEIVDLSNFLRKLGAKVTGAGTSTIRIDGVEKLGGARHAIIPDRIEAGTFMVAAAITGGDVLVENVIPNHMKPIIAKLKESGCKVIEEGDNVRVIGKEIPDSIDIKTLPYPGFPTDMQAQFMAYMTQCKGSNVAIETVFENRFMHVEEFRKMGADIKIDGRSAVVVGPKKLTGARVRASDLRAGAALILVGLVAEGKTYINDIYHIDRGYEGIEDKFRGLGAKVYRIEEDA
ncbi:UDP-N-acetylglucosamine 1-carboxyvinyltransferase 1 [Aedoeadaptatus ivorii]|uniref:UDP-N-acetylglucosamine 1-carboxyvinyltransferase n=1 Tax=Aedoeadaptatus ivorii TaxID=54006 RepID=A0A448V094_9FIRM|nr:UDP-N-acetylglucosamine 1-carboxyvinyltransferase [Peptoniphilus ivorii]MDQ0508048.1 UDP-N-acetylglucosamine 1-carboxyvinyltransferase [Peptoniphilus ivorii]VEJ34955.1 UDP-N-acetylglucosamine 1-carboxyvinyltransferase 1 [Peptoniphilus ivorii]